MYPILETKKLTANIYWMEVKAERIAKSCMPGQFVIVRTDADSERIPLTICDYNREKGTITIVFQPVGASTHLMTSLKAGDAFHDVAGPLGCPSELTKETKEEELQEIIRTVLEDESKKEFIPLSEKIRLSRELFNAFRRLDILQDLIEDDSITEIMVNGTENIFYEKEGKLYRTNRHFFSESRLCDVIQQIVGEANRYVNETSPIVDARLADGSRVNVVLKPVAVNGPIMTIRKFPSKAIKMNDLIKMGSLTKEAAEFIRKIVRSKYNIFVSGGTGAGKTTFLNAMSDFIPKEERIITIEDNAELRIRGIDNLVRLEAKMANMEGAVSVTIRDLIKSALRMRPDRIIVGEVRGGEAMDMLQALNTGHEGSLSTAHANSARDMLSRLETMVLMGVDLPLEAIRRQIASGVDILVHLGRMRDKSRKLLEVTEVCGFENGEIRIRPLYQWQEGKGLVKTASLLHVEKLERAGIEL